MQQQQKSLKSMQILQKKMQKKTHKQNTKKNLKKKWKDKKNAELLHGTVQPPVVV